MDITITIITICYNNLQELLTTCSSVDNQVIKPHEHWIIDGSSNSGIRDHLSATPQPVYRKWISEKDNGIADAFNKGLVRATGGIVNMLNSADHYIDEHTLAIVTETFKRNPGIKWLHGKYRLQRGGKWVIIGKPFDPEKLYRGMRSLAHQSMFVKKELHDRYGLYDTSLNIAMDYDFVCRISKEPFAFVKEPLVVFAPGGTSSVNYLASLNQAKQVFHRYFKPSLKLSLWQMRLKALHYIITSPLGPMLYNLKVRLGLKNM